MNTKEKVLEVHWKLNLAVDYKKKQVLGDLQMPVKLSVGYEWEGIRPPVILELFDDYIVKFNDNSRIKADKAKLYEDKVHALTVMREATSGGIMQAHLVLDGDPLLHVLDAYDGSLADYLNSRNLGIPETYNQISQIVLPTHNLSSAVSQVVGEIERLRICGKYHGNFKLKNTLYIINKEGALVIKLSDFKLKKGSRNAILAADWHSVANGLVEITEIAKKLNAEPNKLPKLITCQLDGLIQFLRDIGPSTAELAFKSIKRQPFFWGKAERKIFFIYIIPQALETAQFRAALDRAKFIPKPWGIDGFDGLLSAMNTYRQRRGQENYKTGSRQQFVQFISGLYTHEEQMEAPVRVDAALQKREPSLCYNLYSLLPGSFKTNET